MDVDAFVAQLKEQVVGADADPSIQDARWMQAAGVMVEQGFSFDEQWRIYQTIFANRPEAAGPPIAWAPARDSNDLPNVERMRQDWSMKSYQALFQSSQQPEFWEDMLRRLAIPFDTPPQAILADPVDVRDPHWLPGARMNIAEACFQADASSIAIIEASEGTDAQRRVTVAELEAMSRQFAAGLQSRGLGEGDGVALYMPMTVECVAAYLGTILAGCHVVSIPDSFAAPEIATRLRLGSARICVTMQSFQRAGKDVAMFAKLDEARAGMGVQAVLVDGGATDTDANWLEFLGEASACRTVHGAPQRVANVLFSSGTTGEPKAIPWTHLTPIKSASDGHLHQDIRPGDVVAWPTNIGWMMGPWLIFASLINRATMFLYQGVPTSNHFVQSVDVAGVTMLGLVPAIVRGWLAGGVAPGCLPRVRVFSSTGEASNVHDYLYLMSLASYRAPIIEYCGGTEIGGGHLTGTVVQPASPATFTTPALGLDFVILGEDGLPVQPGEMGEIFLIPPSIGLSQTLLNKDHHAVYYEGVPEGPGGVQLRRHGDQVHVLHAGFWAPAGRADDTMNLGGIKVGSIELETVLNEHPAVFETAAVAVPPEGGGADRLVVFAVRSGASDDLHAELQQLIKKKLNPLFRIHDVVEVEKLPRTASNKVMRRELRSQYAPTA